MPVTRGYRESLRSAYLLDTLEKNIFDPWDSLSIVEISARLTGMVVVGVKGFDSFERLEALVRGSWAEHVRAEMPRIPEVETKRWAKEILRQVVLPFLFTGPGPASSGMVAVVVALCSKDTTVDVYVRELRLGWDNPHTDEIIASLDAELGRFS